MNAPKEPIYHPTVDGQTFNLAAMLSMVCACFALIFSLSEWLGGQVIGYFMANIFVTMGAMVLLPLLAIFFKRVTEAYIRDGGRIFARGLCRPEAWRSYGGFGRRASHIIGGIYHWKFLAYIKARLYAVEIDAYSGEDYQVYYALNEKPLASVSSPN